MSKPVTYLRLTIDVFVGDDPTAQRIATTIIAEGGDSFGTGETLAREFMEEVGRTIEVDNIFNVEDHSI